MDHPIRGNPRVLDRIFAATTTKRGGEAPACDPAIIRTPIKAPLIERFIAEAVAAGMHITRTTRDALPEGVQTLRKRISIAPVLLDPALDRTHPALRAHLADCLADPTDDELFAADLAVLSAESAIAETGSIVRIAAPDRPRSFALVPMTIIIVLHASLIVADLYDWLAGQPPDRMPSELVLITGPSKSSDIGMMLVTGVHGPGVVHVVVVIDA